MDFRSSPCPVFPATGPTVAGGRGPDPNGVVEGDHGGPGRLSTPVRELLWHLLARSTRDPAIPAGTNRPGMVRPLQTARQLGPRLPEEGGAPALYG